MKTTLRCRATRVAMAGMIALGCMGAAGVIGITNTTVDRDIALAADSNNSKSASNSKEKESAADKKTKNDAMKSGAGGVESNKDAGATKNAKSTDKSAKTQNKSNDEAAEIKALLDDALEYDPEKFYGLYIQNAAKAKKEYEGKQVKLTGWVDTVREKYALLSTGASDNHLITVYLSEDELAELSYGQKVTVVGTYQCTSDYFDGLQNVTMWANDSEFEEIIETVDPLEFDYDTFKSRSAIESGEYVGQEVKIHGWVNDVDVDNEDGCIVIATEYPSWSPVVAYLPIDAKSELTVGDEITVVGLFDYYVYNNFIGVRYASIVPNTYEGEWHQYKDVWSYIKPDHEVARGWYEIEGKWYYFDKNGWMQTNCWIDGTYWVGEDGAMATDATVDGGRYRVDKDGRWIQ